MEPLVISVPALPPARRVNRRRTSVDNAIRVVSARLYGFRAPCKGSFVQVDPVAQRVLEWWPPARQKALYAAIESDQLRFEPKFNGHEMAEISKQFDHHLMVVRREPGRVLIVALYNELPKWKDL